MPRWTPDPLVGQHCRTYSPTAVIIISTTWTLSLCTTSSTWRVTTCSVNSCFTTAQHLPDQMPDTGTTPAAQHSVAYQSKGAEPLVTLMFPTENGFRRPPSKRGFKAGRSRMLWEHLLYHFFRKSQISIHFTYADQIRFWSHGQNGSYSISQWMQVLPWLASVSFPNKVAALRHSTNSSNPSIAQSDFEIEFFTWYQGWTKSILNIHLNIANIHLTASITDWEQLPESVHCFKGDILYHQV